MALTGKRKLFADAVLAGKSNKAAAIEAGYSAKTASPAGSRLAKDNAIVAYIAERRGAAAVKPQAAATPAAPAPTGAAPAAAAPEPARKPFDVGAALLHTDPQAFLVAAMNDSELDPKQRIVAARALMPFMHPKMGEGGKKDSRAAAAKTASTGRFAAGAPPKLVVNNGK